MFEQLGGCVILHAGPLKTAQTPYSQHTGDQWELCRRWGPFQSDVGAVDDAELPGPGQRAAAVNGTGATAPAAVPLRPGAPYLQTAERQKQTGKEVEPRDADAMFSLG